METFDTVTQMVENRSPDVSLPAIYRSYLTLKHSNYTMYRPWKPLGEVLKGDWPGFELTTKGRNLTVDRYVWRNQVCVGGMRIHFEQSIAGLYVVDESVEVTANYSAVPSVFDNSDPTWRGCELWLEENSSRIELYGELGKVNYERLNSATTWLGRMSCLSSMPKVSRSLASWQPQYCRLGNDCFRES